MAKRTKPAPAAPTRAAQPRAGGRFTAKSAPAAADRTATIAQGETFDQTARRLGVDRDALFHANRGVLGSNTDRARPGTPLIIPE